MTMKITKNPYDGRKRMMDHNKNPYMIAGDGWWSWQDHAMMGHDRAMMDDGHDKIMLWWAMTMMDDDRERCGPSGVSPGGDLWLVWLIKQS